MEKLDINNFCVAGFLTKPFLKTEYILEKVNFDYNAKIANNPNYTKLESLYLWIDHVIKFSRDKQFVELNKFNRFASEIWESGFSVGCSDYAILFATFARQLGYPTTILATAEFNWFSRFKGGDNKRHFGHYFCECFYNGKWVLVDPASRKLDLNYNPNKKVINLSYCVGDSYKFIPYLRCLDLGKKQNIDSHNLEMDMLCNKIKID